MVNPGHPSKGCITCKRRRIKCDERRPTCVQCAKSKKTCLGYDSQKSSGTTRCGNARLVESDLLEELVAQRTRGKYTRLAARLLKDGTMIDYNGSIPQPISLQNQLSPLSIGSVKQPTLPTHPNSAIEAVISTAFQSLQAPAQTIEAHRDLQQRYQRAIHDLASTLSPTGNLSDTSCTSAYLFALYEVHPTTTHSNPTPSLTPHPR
jgi:hypothetical protein